MDGYTIALLAINLFTFFLYGLDKLNAQTGRYRLSEATLITLSVCTGGIGGLLAMTTFRHKTHHKYFWVANAVGVITAIAAVVAIYKIIKG